MSELRRDPFTGTSVIVAPERAERPITAAARWEFSAGSCPFCPGAEDQTPSALMIWPEPAAASAPEWQIRVVPNKYPAVGWSDRKEPPPSEPLRASQPGLGAHELIIESPRHVASLTDLDSDSAATVGEVYRRRLAALAGDSRLRSALLFKNVGAEAGASLEHTHSQILALTEVPSLLACELALAERWWQSQGGCGYCQMLAEETALGTRLVAEAEGLVALAPWASRWPCEVWILPRRHASRYDRIDPQEAHCLGRMLHRVLGRLETVLGRAAYNFFLHQGPFDSLELPHYHWHVEIIPRVSTVAGFEWGTNWFVNPVAPERAAAALRGESDLAGGPGW